MQAAIARVFIAASLPLLRIGRTLAEGVDRKAARRTVRGRTVSVVVPVLFPNFPLPTTIAEGALSPRADELTPDMEAHVEPLNERRARLRRELRRAYDAWLLTSELPTDPIAPDRGVDVSGSPDAAKAKWFAYLAAKERLVLAYAEQPLAA